MSQTLLLPARHRYCLSLLGVYAVLWAALAWEPSNVKIWWMENILVLGFLGYLAISYRGFPLSRLSYGLIFLFLCLHTVGAHYSYGDVPYNAWSEALLGTPLNDLMGWERHNFDRIVHLSYGLLLVYPIRELYLRVAGMRGFWSYILPVNLVLATSAFYELVEWIGVTWVGGELGRQYIASQGDEWDAQKDMFLAAVGSLGVMLFTLAVNAYRQRDFLQEWNESVAVKDRRPRGEETLVRTLNGQGGRETGD